MLVLENYYNGQTDYIDKLNQNNSRIENAVDQNTNSVEALKTASSAGSDQDYRTNIINLLDNGSFEVWQRGIRPDRWLIENTSVSLNQTEYYYGIKSIKTVGIGRVYQKFTTEVRNKLKLKNLCFGCYIKTNTHNAARLSIKANGIQTKSDYVTGNNTWLKRFKALYFANYPTTLKFELLIEKDVTVYWNAAMLIFGNPNAGPVFQYRNVINERNRCLTFYEEGITSYIGKGVLIDSEYQLSKWIPFIIEKYDIPTIDITLSTTGLTYEVETITKTGFVLTLKSFAEDIIDNDIDWIAEVTGY